MKKFFASPSTRYIVVALIVISVVVGAMALANRPKLPSLSGDNVATDRGHSVSPDSTTDTLVIPKLHITAPLFLHVSASDEATYLKTLENGVAHYDGTALPGEEGNTFIFGHSEYDKDKPGNFKEVFKHLDALVVGDMMTITTGKGDVTYRVTDKKIVADTDVSVLNQVTNGKHELTLMTCWPPGTIDKRYIVKAEQVQ
jgi:sortase A